MDNSGGKTSKTRAEVLVEGVHAGQDRMFRIRKREESNCRFDSLFDALPISISVGSGRGYNRTNVER